MLHRSAVCLVVVTLATAFAAVPADAQPRRNRPRARTAAPVTQTVTGRLEAGDLQLDDNEYADTLSVALRVGQTLEAEMTRTDGGTLDTYLLVVGPPSALGADDGEALAQNDDATEGDTRRSVVRVTAARAGRHEVWATSYGPRESGAYELRLTVGEATATPPPRVPPTPAPAPTAPAAPAPASRPAASPTAGAPSRPVANHVVGRITDGQGRPIAGVIVSINGTALRSGERVAFRPRAGADGRYSVEVPAGSYWVSAEHSVDFDGQRYTFDLDALDQDPGRTHESPRGVVKDFVWRLAGLRPDRTSNPDSYFSHHGGTVQLGMNLTTSFMDTEPVLLPVGTLVRIRLVPRGPLVDGSAGAPIVIEKRVEAGRTGLSGDFYDVPVARYTATAEAVLPDGSVRPLTLEALYARQPAARSIDVWFEPDSYPDTRPRGITLTL